MNSRNPATPPALALSLRNKAAGAANVRTQYLPAGRSIGRLGYGTMQLAGSGVFGPPKDNQKAIAVLHEAVERGVNHIDTADFYGPHVTNRLIREALHPYPEDLVIVTKVGAKRGPSGSVHQGPPRIERRVSARRRKKCRSQAQVPFIRRCGCKPLTSITACEILFDRMKLHKDPDVTGGTLLVLNGAGGVGSMMIQLATRLTDLTVIASASRALKPTNGWEISARLCHRSPPSAPSPTQGYRL